MQSLAFIRLLNIINYVTKSDFLFIIKITINTVLTMKSNFRRFSMGMWSIWTVRTRYSNPGHVPLRSPYLSRRPSSSISRLRRDPRGRNSIHRRLRRVLAERCRHRSSLPYVRGLQRNGAFEHYLHGRPGWTGVLLRGGPWRYYNRNHMGICHWSGDQVHPSSAGHRAYLHIRNGVFGVSEC